MNVSPKKIPMVDLVGQYRRLQLEIDAAMSAVLEAGDFIQGSSVKMLEQELCEYLSVEHTVTCGNGTDALQLAFMALDLPKGSEVILPSFAYAALAEVILLLGLTPIFAEVNPQTYLMDPADVALKVSNKTKAIAPVHLFGAVCDMDAIVAIAHEHGLYVVEDAAQAIGSYYQGNRVQGFAGTMGTVGTTSFFPSKNLGCYGDGGAVFCRDSVLAGKIRQLANHGQSTKYIHDIVGVNSRLDTLQAAILRVKLGHLTDFNQRRFRIAKNYQRSLESLQELGLVELPKLDEEIIGKKSMLLGHVFHQYTIKLVSYEKREAFRQFLSDSGIPTMVYYPLPLHRQKAYFQSVSIPITEQLCNSVVSLPICPELSLEAQNRIVTTIEAFFKLPK